MGWLQSVEMQLACQSRGEHFALYQKALSFSRQGKNLKNVYNWSSCWYVMSSCRMIFSSVLLFVKKKPTMPRTHLRSGQFIFWREPMAVDGLGFGSIVFQKCTKVF